MRDEKQIRFSLNGEEREFEVRPDEKLLDLLRRSGLLGVKHGCGEASCGACTVIVDGRAVYACVLYAFQASGRSVWTIEGVGSFRKPHPVQEALVEESAVQCGFCIPGMVLSAKAMLDENPSPKEEEVREHMDGNLCRCTGYVKIWGALQRVILSAKKGGAR
jgi:aerobic-type carbon monoxide dehydrogenase small subunit (CoxS/CutS family)